MERWASAGFVTAVALSGMLLYPSTAGRGAQISTDKSNAAQATRVERIQRCERQRADIKRDAYLSAARDQTALIAHLDGADPTRDAQDAAARGDFRLIRTISEMGTYPFALECRLPTDNRPGGLPLTLAIRFYSDVPGSCETRGSVDPCKAERLLDAYAPAYNAALVSNPRYPYGDLCRVPEGRVKLSFDQVDPVDYGFPGLAETGRPIDLYEAARRGTPAAVARMIATAGKGGLDRPDPYDMTPLAWAVARRRPAIAAKLLAAGASPIGGECDAPDRRESPLRLALWTGQGALAKIMLRRVQMARLTPWPAGLLAAAEHGEVADLLPRRRAN